MHVKIIGFKIHIDVDFIFNNNEMTLLKGSSGAGKSTILQSIYWALYGNMRSIYNNSGITKNLSVTLSLPGITIIRKKNPELLTVDIGGNIYEDLVAQNVIEDLYGNRELWKACSYIEQKTRCALLSGTGGERLELLNALSFTGENPKEYISKIGEKLKEMNINFDKNQSSFLTELNIYTKNLEEKPVKHLLKEEDINSLKGEITNLEKNLEQQNEKVLEQERLLGKYNYLVLNCQNLKSKCEELRKITFKYIEFYPSPKPSCELESDIIIPEYLYNIIPKPILCELSIIDYNDYTKHKNILNKQLIEIYNIVNKKEQLEKDIEKLENNLKNDNEHLNDIEKVTEEDIWKAEKIKLEREKYLQECKSIGLEYNQEKINDTLKQLSEQLSIYTNLAKYVPNYNRLLEIENKLLKITENGDIKELEKLSNEKSLIISDLKKGLELLSCPKCKIPLRYINGNLELGDREPVSKTEIEKTEKEYKEILEKINKLRIFNNLEESANSLRSSIDVDLNQLKEFINSGNKISTLSNFITKISNIKYIEDVNIEKLKCKYNYQQLNIKRKELEQLKIEDDTNIKEKIQELEEKYSLEQKRIKENQDRIKEHQNKENQRLKELNKYEMNKKLIKERNEKRIKNLEKFNKEEEERTQLYNLEKEKLNEEKLKVKREIVLTEEKLFEVENDKNILEKQIDLKCKDKYEIIKNNLQEKKQLIDEALYSLTVVEKGKELEEKRNKLICLQKDVQTLNKLKLKAVEIEHKQLEDTVNNINTVLETTLPIFFTEPISMSLLLYKKVKNNVKPGLNLEICYKGCKYDNINCLSGGEGDRISLALLLALNFVSNSPIIMLDECVSSLDGDLKEKCIEAIKSIPNKTVICVDHDDGLEGFYDCVISI